MKTQKPQNLNYVYDQGDVRLLGVTPPTEELTPVPDDMGRVILAYGEVTGHAHAIEDLSSAALFATPSGQRFLQVKKPVAIKHEEHRALSLEPGWYNVHIDTEYQPGALPRRVVAD